MKTKAAALAARDFPILGSARSWRRSLGLLIAAAGAVLLVGQLIGETAAALAASSPLRDGVVASLIAGVATGLGALPVLLFRQLDEGRRSVLLGVGGGVMLAAAIFSLLVPSLDLSAGIFGSPLAGAAAVGLALAAGAAAIAWADRKLPHAHLLQAPASASAADVHSAWLLVGAIGLHNFPEGFAVGAGFGGGAELGMSTAVGIGVQNLPEGLVVAAALAGLGYSRLFAIGVATVTGLFEPLGALAGGVLTALAGTLLPLAMSFAAGAMLFVVSHEVIPESHRLGRQGAATGGLIAGFITMVLLGTALG